MLSHRDAAALWGVRRSARGAIDITVVGATRRSRPKLTIHSTGALQPADRMTVDRIPVTSIARTLLDLAEVVSPTQLQRAYEEAERLRILDVREVAELLARSNGRRGARRLSALLDYDPVAVVDSRSELESRFVDLVREAGIPLPHMNVIVEGYEVDAYWPEARLVVELQGYRNHSHRSAFERDHTKIARLKRAGCEVLPLTWRQVTRERRSVVDLITTLRSRARPRVR
jgi:hypothetical protein